MFDAIVFCPQPPLLVGDTAGAAASELDNLRACCASALTRTTRYRTPVTIVGDAAGIALGHWLLDQSDLTGPRAALNVDANTTTNECQALGEGLVDGAAIDSPSTMLVMGDGSARRGERAPGYIDERAVGFDDGIGRALDTADTSALLKVSAELATDLMAAGRAPWQVAAAAAFRAGYWRGQILFADDPYGVMYFVALWTRGASNGGHTK